VRLFMFALMLRGDDWLIHGVFHPLAA